ncbi:uncharacterized protein LOC110657390 [Hevea brasiliensis]|uniref:uncharacterized protein LOC110657390 n=1 Tax=Hevea brasiliensis TaxID=3981 RepID=UPI0025D87D5F|nr:uncharacterized protein LOC110657390 [Hevea brasiliensis]
MNMDKALCDLGASVSLMPLSICKKLDVGELKPTIISLQLADRSVKYPMGILENIPIKVEKFSIPVDFLVLEMEENVQIPIILERPFLAIARAIIGIKNILLTLNIRDEEVEFNLVSVIKHKLEPDECFKVDIIEKQIEEEFIKAYLENPLGASIVQNRLEKQDISIKEEPSVEVPQDQNCRSSLVLLFYFF